MELSTLLAVQQAALSTQVVCGIHSLLNAYGSRSQILQTLAGRNTLWTHQVFSDIATYLMENNPFATALMRQWQENKFLVLTGTTIHEASVKSGIARRVDEATLWMKCFLVVADFLEQDPSVWMSSSTQQQQPVDVMIPEIQLATKLTGAICKTLVQTLPYRDWCVIADMLREDYTRNDETSTEEDPLNQVISAPQFELSDSAHQRVDVAKHTHEPSRKLNTATNMPNTKPPQPVLQKPPQPTISPKPRVSRADPVAIPPVDSTPLDNSSSTTDLSALPAVQNSSKLTIPNALLGI